MMQFGNPYGLPQFGQQYGQQTPYGGQQMPYGQFQPQMGAMVPQPQAPVPASVQPQSKGHGMFGNPMFGMISPFGYLLANHPKAALSMMSPAFGIANLLGAFK